MSPARLRRVRAEELPRLLADPLDEETLAVAGAIIADVRGGGEAALRAHAERLGDVAPGAALHLDRAALQRALGAVSAGERELLERTAAQIRAFAEAQRASLTDLRVAVPGGEAGHTVAAVQRAGCYAPGGRYPLPSSVLMTAVVARVAGVEEVWVASPRPQPLTLAAAAVAGADGLLCVGGAQAIAALVYGAGPVPPCDAVVGPGNRFVTAAKQLVAGRVTIDMLAGPSELLILADQGADPVVCAADLLAQAEHDPDALPMLCTPHAGLVDAVDAELERQLATLPSAAIARAALSRGFAVLVSDLDEGARVCDRIAPEHLEVLTADAAGLGRRLRHYGSLFLGPRSAEVFGDYGVGPNHVLPTGGTARRAAGLSVFTFLRVRTFLHLTHADDALCADAAALARLEGLEGHARAADARRGSSR